MKRTLITLLGAALLSSCNLLQDTSSSKEENPSPKQETTAQKEEKEKEAPPERSRYNPSHTRINDLVHTKLELRFDYEKKHVLGKAYVTFTPHFFPTDSLTLDAKGFDLHTVAKMEDTVKNELAYQYDEEQIHIQLDSTYSRKDTFKIFVDYTAKPEERESEGSSAISSAQGLYFIDPDSTDPNKPTQIWTQGETESNSCWFPTIDKPNQRMSQELFITVPSKYKSLSNGALVYSLENKDGTRTDYWKQELTHPPYLTMMAIGDYAVVKDSWDDINLHYWVEKDYEEAATSIFGETPNMVEFFSNVLGVAYPWAKYDQVIVRDFVSGAMENTTATVHGEFVQKTRKELIDGGNESIIAHELIHHWFGDMVTCESWANLPLNEAFATYGEYLWFEHSKGRDAADHHNQTSMSGYMRSSRNNKKDLIRYDYHDKEDMFDAHSYNKGGRILHMLRKNLGDSAFFASLEHYLKENAYEPVEVHELRLAIEETTGKDLNWFFDQWFLDKGHPVLKIRQEYDTAAQEQVVRVEQTQDFETTPLYKLPIKIDLYFGGKRERKSVVIDEAEETFRFKTSEIPDLVNVDGQKMLLAEKNEEKPLKQWVHQFYHAPLYLDRYEAIRNCSGADDKKAAKVILDGLNDDFWNIKLTAMQSLNSAMPYFKDQIRNRLEKMVTSSDKSTVRASALTYLNQYFDKGLSKLYQRALKDSSYMVISTALKNISQEHPKQALDLASAFENEEGAQILTTLAEIYSQYAGPEKLDFYLKAGPKISNPNLKIGFLRTYGSYLIKQDHQTAMKGIPLLEEVVIEGGQWYTRVAALRAILGLQEEYKDRADFLEANIKDLENKQEAEEGTMTEKEQKEIEEKKTELKKLRKQERAFDPTLERIKENVDNQRVLNQL